MLLKNFLRELSAYQAEKILVKTDMSLIHLISNASILVQLVMGLLLLISIVSWVIIFQRFSVLSKAEKYIRLFEEEFWSGGPRATLCAC